MIELQSILIYSVWNYRYLYVHVYLFNSIIAYTNKKNHRFIGIFITESKLCAIINRTLISYIAFHFPHMISMSYNYNTNIFVELRNSCFFLFDQRWHAFIKAFVRHTSFDRPSTVTGVYILADKVTVGCSPIEALYGLLNNRITQCSNMLVKMN